MENGNIILMKFGGGTLRRNQTIKVVFNNRTIIHDNHSSPSLSIIFGGTLSELGKLFDWDEIQKDWENFILINFQKIRERVDEALSKIG